MLKVDKVLKELQDQQVLQVHKVRLVIQEPKVHKDLKVQQVLEVHKVHKDLLEPKVLKEGLQEPKEPLVTQEPKGLKEE